MGENSCVKNRPWYYTGSDGEIYHKAYKYVGSIEKECFKVEPLRWRILEEKDVVATLLCDRIIDAEFFGGNNFYAGSMLSNWLNGHVYETAFTDEERQLILPTMLDNSAESTGIENNPYVCYDCEEHVFLLSYKEAFETYGLTDKDRMRETTDFAESRCSRFSSCYDWYLRSPDDMGADWILAVDGDDGKLTNANLSEWYYGGSDGSDGASTGVVPAIRIKLQ